jgi:hypothetical protein
MEEAKYTFELFLSTDGKHTVRVSADTPEGCKKAYEVAVQTYEQILKKYGTKQQQEKLEKEKVKEFDKMAEKEKQESCGHQNKKVFEVKQGKNAGRKFVKCLDCGKFLGWAK